ncbi:ComF family protein [Candidatus Peregrinibacteria bacterium]|nr:ComF family protein [Candidatus Peregrinibacteria bacterium]
MLDLLLDLIFPRRSLAGQTGTYITREEFSKLTPFPLRLESSVLRTMGLKHLDRIVAAGSYAGAPLLRRAIYTWKYGRVKGMGEELGKLLIDVVPILYADTKKCVLCPVPLHWSREFYRGFNQAEQLATILSDSANIPMVRCLRRMRATGFQARRRGIERRQSMSDMFRCALNPMPSHIILVDDIMTTGATMDACAKELKAHGAKWVGGLVLAKG